MLFAVHQSQHKVQPRACAGTSQCLSQLLSQSALWQQISKLSAEQHQQLAVLPSACGAQLKRSLRLPASAALTRQ
jgi:hypothetical protein